MSIEQYTQLSFFAAPETNADPREPITVTWNMHHGCNRVSPGCKYCYVFRRDAEYGIDTTKVHILVEDVAKSGNFTVKSVQAKVAQTPGRTVRAAEPGLPTGIPPVSRSCCSLPSWAGSS